MAGSALAEWEDLPVEEYLGKLRAAQGRLPEELIAVESSLALSDALLSDALRARWYALSIFPETFGRAGAQAVWGVESAAEAQAALSELLRYSLVEYDAQGQRYRLHDLCRAYAAARLEPEAAEAARARHAAHYAQVFREADRLYVSSGFDAAVLKLYDRERANILAGQAHAASRLSDPGTVPSASLAADVGDIRRLPRTPAAGEAPAGVDIEAARRYLAYVPPALGSGLILIRLLVIRLDAAQRVAWWQTGLRAAQQLGDHDAEMRCLLWLAMAHRELGQFRPVLSQVKQALAIARQLGDRGGEAASLHQLSIACSVVEGPAKALPFCEQCLAIAHELGWPLVEAMALRFLAQQYLELEQPHRAWNTQSERWLSGAA